MILEVYLVILLISGIILRGIKKITGICHNLVYSVPISAVLTIIICYPFTETKVIKEEAVFLPAEYYKDVYLKTEDGRRFYIENSKVVLDTITGVTLVKTKREVPGLGGLWTIGNETEEVVRMSLNWRD